MLHDVIVYRSNLSRSYLEREPESYTPAGRARAVEKVGHIGMLNPTPTRIELQIYPSPNEYILVLEGENLWFCHKIQLGDYNNRVDIDTDFLNTTQRMIRFNFPPNERLIGLAAQGVVKLTLNSHFANPVRQSIEVQVIQAN